jgi:hypothetical protein
MYNNRPFYLAGLNDETRAGLQREHVRNSNMRLIADLARDEYHQLMRQEWKQCFTTSDNHEWDDDDAA